MEGNESDGKVTEGGSAEREDRRTNWNTLGGSVETKAMKGWWRAGWRVTLGRNFAGSCLQNLKENAELGTVAEMRIPESNYEKERTTARFPSAEKRQLKWREFFDEYQ